MPATSELHLAGMPATTDDASIFFVGNATVLIRYAGFVILTDPNFVHRHEEVPIGYGMHATRQTDPAIEIGDLPPIDLIVLSHFHGDHFDQVAERELDRSLPIVTTPEAAEELQERGFTAVRALETWDQLLVTRGGQRLSITATPGRHGPPVVDLALPEVMGSILEFSAREGGTRRLYISGDTLVYDDLEEIPNRYPDIDVALLHLGGTRVLGIMVTMDGEQGAELLALVNPRRAIPIHYDDYDVFTSPLSEFEEAVRQRGLQARVQILARGDSWQIE